MAEVAASTAEIQRYSVTAGSLAAEVAGAAAAATTSGPALLAPIFGLIGTEFLGAAAGVHAAHTSAVARLAEVVASLGVQAAASGIGYELTDAATARSLT
jgi:ribose/xylose/arabinose/galactoside ABC-type transport system permease subunit